MALVAIDLRAVGNDDDDRLCCLGRTGLSRASLFELCFDNWFFVVLFCFFQLARRLHLHVTDVDAILPDTQRPIDKQAR